MARLSKSYLASTLHLAVGACLIAGCTSSAPGSPPSHRSFPGGPPVTPTVGAPTGGTSPSTSATLPRISSGAQGGVDSGGGSYVGSDPQQIAAVFNGDNGFNLKETIKGIFKQIEFQVWNKEVSADLESIFSRMLGEKFSGDPFDVFQDIEKSTYELKLSGPCLEDISGGLKDAGTTIDKKAAPICFSMDGLKRLPLQAVAFQLVALAVHEHAHHYGFDESDAVKVQKHVLETMNLSSLNAVYLDAISAAESLRNHSKKVAENLRPEISDKVLCKHIATLNSTVTELSRVSEDVHKHFDLRLLSTALDHKHGLTKKSFEGIEEAKFLAAGMLVFCGDDPLTTQNWTERVEEGDRAKLRVNLMKISALANKIIHQAIDNAKGRKQKP